MGAYMANYWCDSCEDAIPEAQWIDGGWLTTAKGETISVCEDCYEELSEGDCEECKNGAVESYIFSRRDSETGELHDWERLCSACAFKELIKEDTDVIDDTCRPGLLWMLTRQRFVEQGLQGEDLDVAMALWEGNYTSST